MTAPDQDVRWTGRHAIVTMPDEIDLTNSGDLHELVAAVIGQSPETVTIDMTATTFCDSAGISVLARAHELAMANGGELRIALGHSPVARIIQLVGLDQVVPVYPDVQHSLDGDASSGT
ncbi:MAG TPA: STAS domain-containing protein [Streptosporangiaceae bacterium]|nr:STAS domain-containing protein [Streptosporangiaceae bacterium]